MLVYCFYSKVNGECMYVGSTAHIGNRMKVHRHDSKADEKVLYQKIREIGWDNVEVKSLATDLNWTLTELRCEERKHIEELNPLYNIYRSARTEEEKIALVAESKKKCYEAKKDEYLARAKIHRDSHLEEQAERGKAWREANREENLAKKKAYREANKDAINAKAKEAREANPEAYKAKQDARNAKVKEALIASRLKV